MPTLDRYLTTWQSADLGPELLPAEDGHLVTTKRGARVVPFDDRGRPLLWLAAAVQPDADVAAWSATDAWNFGAERLWLGPELRLMVKDREDFHGSYQLSRQLDPGDWERGGGTTSVDARPAATARPSAAPGSGLEQGLVTYHQELDLAVHQPAARLRLGVEQRIAEAANPARRWQQSQGLKHLGWSREVTLERAGDDEGSVACQSWVLAQVQAPATVLVPGAGAAQVTDYFEPIGAALWQRRGADLALAVTGSQRYKVGIRSAEHRAVIACWRELPDGEAALLVRHFFDAPSSRYLEEPPSRPGHEGDSLYVYNDDGRFGGFGEIEALGRALEPSSQKVTDLFEMHAWWGPREPLRALAMRLLGADPADVQWAVPAPNGSVAKERA